MTVSDGPSSDRPAAGAVSLGGISLGGELGVLTCSRAGCRNSAGWCIRWKNPKIHTGDRFKTWLACDEHVDYLRDFLGAREFPLEVSALETDENAR